METGLGAEVGGAEGEWGAHGCGKARCARADGLGAVALEGEGRGEGECEAGGWGGGGGGGGDGGDGVVGVS